MKSKRKLKGCLIALAVIIVVPLLICIVSAAIATPDAWLYLHNYYYQGLTDFLHGKH